VAERRCIRNQRLDAAFFRMRKKPATQFEAMEARSVNEIPRGKEWQYEPKWDGFRCLLSRDGDAVIMLSKAGQDLTRYFPEVASAWMVRLWLRRPRLFRSTTCCNVSILRRAA
jgi:ATP-dependent DNA ligase